MDNLNIDNEWDANTLFSFLQEEGDYDSSSPEGAHDQSWSSPHSKNILSERSRREKLKQRLYALRSVVPNITKLDKASIVKDAIGYIESLHEEERKMKAEIAELESGTRTGTGTVSSFYMDHHHSSSAASCNYPELRAMEHYQYQHSAFMMPTSSHPIELLELRVCSMGERTIVVSLTCSKRTDTMVKLCQIFDSLNLNIITANISAFSGRILKTVFLQGDEEDKDDLSSKIRAAMAAPNYPDSPMSI